LEQAQDQVKSVGDSIAGSVQPGRQNIQQFFDKQMFNILTSSAVEGEKGVGQKASDFVSGTGTGSGEQGQGVLAQAQEMAGNAAETVKDTLGLNQPSKKSQAPLASQQTDFHRAVKPNA
jgi:hypothetical protein